MKQFHNIINGKRFGSRAGETIISVNPATEQPIARFPKGGTVDVQAAIASAELAFDEWSHMPAPKRGQILLKAAELLRKNKHGLGKLVTMEMGKILSEGLGDVQESIDMFEYAAGEGRRLFGHTTTSELPDKLAMTVRAPVGVMGLITPWNFPTAIPAWKLAPCLVCGNTAVFKPASDTPLCALRMVEILEKAGLPPGVVNFVAGSGSEVGAEIVRSKMIRGVSFTGSREVGEFVVKNAGVKKVGLELGGKNGIIVMDDADLKLALDGIIFGAYGTTGQRCTATSRVIVHRKVRQRLERMLVARIRKLRIGNGLRPSTDVGPLINQAAVDKVHEYTHIGQDEDGARLVAGGEKARVNGKGFFYKPTLFTNVTTDMRIAQEEIFGPSLAMIEAKNLDDAIDSMNSVTYGLSAAIYTKDVRRAMVAVRDIEAGLVYVNSSTIGSEVHLPFGGVKQTGNGAREGGIHGIDEFSETKTVYVDYSGRLQKAQIDV
jgi:aldehyde dehydrogenase (NAD+)